MVDILIKNGFIVTMDNERRVFPNGARAMVDSLWSRFFSDYPEQKARFKDRVAYFAP